MLKFLTAIVFSGIALSSCQTKPEHAGNSADTTKEKGTAVAVVQQENELPPVILIDETGNRFSATTLPGKSIFIFFSSDCDHCQREAADIQSNMNGFANYSLYFISMNAFPQMKKFAETYKLADKSNVKFLQADGSSVFQAMGSLETPTICVYDGNKKLVKRFNGETKAELILKEL